MWLNTRLTITVGMFVTADQIVSLLKEEGGATSQQGEIRDELWEIFKLAFTTPGRIVVLSNMSDGQWMLEYRFLEVVR